MNAETFFFSSCLPKRYPLPHPSLSTFTAVLVLFIVVVWHASRAACTAVCVTDFCRQMLNYRFPNMVSIDFLVVFFIRKPICLCLLYSTVIQFRNHQNCLLLVPICEHKEIGCLLRWVQSYLPFIAFCISEDFAYHKKATLEMTVVVLQWK